MMSKAPNASGLSGTSQPPAIAASIRPSRRSPERLAERHRPRRARVRGREDRAADVERDPEIGRRRAAEHRQREVRRDLADALVQVPLVLLLGVGDAAERRAEVDPDPLGRRPRRAAPGDRPRVVEREPAGDQAELAEPVELPRGLRRHPRERVEVVDLGGDLRAERTRVEAVDPPDRRTGRAEARPGRRRRRCRSAVMTPMPVIQTRRRSASSRDRSVGPARGRRSARRPRRAVCVATASAIALNVASVRPAIGRVKPAVDERRRARARRGAKSCSIETWQPVAVRLDAPGDVHAAVAPATWTNRSRRVRARDQVRARHATGRPMPRTGTNGRRAMKSTTSVVRAGAPEPSSARSGAGGRAQRSTSRARPNTSVGRRGDVDGDRGVHRPVRSRRQERGEEARVERTAGRHEIAHHEAHRRTDGVARRDPPGRVVEQRRPRQERLDEPRDARPWPGTGARIARS